MCALKVLTGVRFCLEQTVQWFTFHVYMFYNYQLILFHTSSLGHSICKITERKCKLLSVAG